MNDEPYVNTYCQAILGDGAGDGFHVCCRYDGHPGDHEEWDATSPEELRPWQLGRLRLPLQQDGPTVHVPGDPDRFPPFGTESVELRLKRLDRSLAA